MIVALATWETAMGALIPPRLSRLSKYALRSLPRATTRCEGVASGTSTSNGPEPPRSLSKLSRSSQFSGTQKSAGEPLKIGPGWKRITASPPSQLPFVPEVFAVVTNGFLPSLAMPPVPHIAPPPVLGLVAAAHAVTLDGSSIGMPTSQPRYGGQSLILPYPT